MNRTILDNNISDALEKYGGFFAFGNEQFVKDGVLIENQKELGFHYEQEGLL